MKSSMMKKVFNKGFARRNKDKEPAPKVIPEEPVAEPPDAISLEPQASMASTTTKGEESPSDSLSWERSPPPMPPSNRPIKTAMPSEERNVFKDSPQIKKAYDAVPVLEQNKLPRGGVSIETKAVGRIQVSDTCVEGGLVGRDFPFSFALIKTHFILFFSLVFHRKRSRIACGWVCQFHRCILYQLSVSVERWALH
jgi:hypothetical protein